MHAPTVRRCLTILAATTLLSVSASAAQAQWFGFYWNWPSWGYRPYYNYSNYYAGYRPYAYTSYYAPSYDSYASYAPSYGYSSYGSSSYDPCCSCAAPCGCNPCNSCGSGGCYGGNCSSGNCASGNCGVSDAGSWSSDGRREPTPADPRGPSRTFDNNGGYSNDPGRDDPVLPSRGFEPRNPGRDTFGAPGSSPADDALPPRSRTFDSTPMNPTAPGTSPTTPGTSPMGPTSPMEPFSRPPRNSGSDSFGGSGDRESFRVPTTPEENTEPSTIPQKSPAPAITPPETAPVPEKEETAPALKLDDKSTWRTVAVRERLKIRSVWPAPSIARHQVTVPETNWQPVPAETKVAGR